MRELLPELRVERGVRDLVVGRARTRDPHIEPRREWFCLRVEVGRLEHGAIEVPQGFAPFVIQSRNSL